MKYNLLATVTLNVFTTVKANSLEEAIEISKTRDVQSEQGNPKKDWILDGDYAFYVNDDIIEE